jgi:hypothetical protein
VFFAQRRVYLDKLVHCSYQSGIFF